MGNCKECKYWDVSVDWEYGQCLRIDETSLGRLAAVAGVIHGSLLATKPEFGCVLFEAK
jgi:hypothetical protein